MKIKIYDLLGLVKDGKAPKKIKYRDNIWGYVSTIMGTGYQYYSTFFEEWKTLQNQVYLEEHLNDEVEIIEEPKKIEKLPYYSLEKIQKSKNKDEQYENRLELLEKRINDYHNKINELIDEINNLKEND